MSAAAARLRQRDLCRAWAAWRQRVEEQQQKSAKLEQAVNSWRQGALRAAWAGWREGMQQQQEKHARLQAAVHLWQHHQLRSAWATWQAHCAFKRYARTAVARMRNRSLAAAFAGELGW